MHIFMKVVVIIEIIDVFFSPIKVEDMGRIVDMFISQKINKEIVQKVLHELLAHPEKTPEEVMVIFLRGSSAALFMKLIFTDCG